MFLDVVSSYRQLEECKASCNSLLDLTGTDLSSDSTPLTSSALNALFLLKNNNEHQEEDESSYEHSISHKNGVPQPTSMPPVIRILIGSVEDEKVFSSDKRKEKSNKRISTVGYIDEKNFISTIGGGNKSGHKRLKNRTTRKGRYRMKTLNSEWENALRWVAEWGSTDEKNQKKEKTTSMKKHVEEIRENNKYFNSAIFLDACFKECVSNINEDVLQRINQIESGPLDLYISWFSFGENHRKDMKRYIVALYNSSFSFYVTLVLFVGQLAYLIRFCLTWLRSKRAEKVHDWISSMGKDEYNSWSNNVGTKGQQKQNSNGSKLSGKKTRKKRNSSASTSRRDEKPNRFLDHQQHVKRKNDVGQSPQANPSSTIDEENHEMEVYEESQVDQIDDRNGALSDSKHKTYRPRSYSFLQKNSSKVTDEQNLEGINPLEEKWKVISKKTPKLSRLGSLHDYDENCITGKPIEYNSTNHSLSLNRASAIVVPGNSGKLPISGPFSQSSHELRVRDFLTPSDNLEQQIGDNFHKFQSSLVDDSVSDIASIFSNVKNGTSPNHIPTEKEKSEALEQLRIYQTTQINKLIESKKARYSQKIKDIDHSDIGASKKNTGWSSLFFSSFINRSPNKERPNPLSDEITKDDFSHAEDCLTGDELLLSNMLDEEDEHEQGQKNNGRVKNVHSNVSCIVASVARRDKFVLKGESSYSWESSESNVVLGEKGATLWGNTNVVVPLCPSPWSTTTDSLDSEEPKNAWGSLS